MGLQLSASTSALCAPAVEKKKTPAFQFRAIQKDNYYQLFWNGDADFLAWGLVKIRVFVEEGVFPPSLPPLPSSSFWTQDVGHANQC